MEDTRHAHTLKIAIVLLALCVLHVFMFPTLNRVHSYYHLEWGIFLLVAVAALIGLLHRKSQMVVLLALVVLELTTFEAVYAPQLHANNGAVGMGLAIMEHTKPDDVLLVAGEEWDPEIPYYAHRRAIMCTTLAPLDTCMKVAKRVHIGAVIDCRGGGCRITFLDH